MDAQKAVNGVGIQFRDLDRIKVELVPENYRNRGAEPHKGPCMDGVRGARVGS